MIIQSIGILLLIGIIDDSWCREKNNRNLSANASAKKQKSETLPATSVVLDPTKIVSPDANGVLSLNLTDSILTALEHNKDLSVERLNPAIRRSMEEQQKSIFDPVLSGQGNFQRTKTQPSAQLDPRIGKSVNNTYSGNLSFQSFLPTGTTLGISGNTLNSDATLNPDLSSNTRFGFNVTQSLLNGFGTRVNLASVRQARLDTLSSEYELRGVAQTLTANVETTYWDYSLAQRQLEIFTDSLHVAEQQLQETDERIRVGKTAESERAAAQAEVALRREDLINARSAIAKTRLQLLRLINPPADNLWKQDIQLMDHPAIPEERLDDVEVHVELALQKRPDLNQARLSVQRGDLEIVRTKNGLLPKLDLFIALGQTGYADSFFDSAGRINGNNYDLQTGLRLEYPLGNRAASSRYQQAQLNREQVELSLENMRQLAQVDVRTAYIEFQRTQEQIEATRASRELQGVKLHSETEKFRVGKSTNLLVAQAQRDLLSAQISEVQAVVNNLKALVDLYRLEGSLLDRRGITIFDVSK